MYIYIYDIIQIPNNILKLYINHVLRNIKTFKYI